jgi:hypothetical protein
MERPHALYFLHIPKTAGTAVIDALDRYFAPEAILPAQLIPDLEKLPPEALRATRYVRGHLGARLELILGRPVTTFTILRDPLERTLSHFAHVQREPGHYLHARVGRPGFGLEDFLADRDCRQLVTNTQARFLVRPAHAPAEPPPMYRSHPLAAQVAYELSGLGMDEETLLRRAKHTLATFAAVGVTDDVDEALGRLARYMGWTDMPHAQRKRVTPNGVARRFLTPEVRAEIARLTRVDAALVSAARGDRQVAATDVWHWDPVREAPGSRGFHRPAAHELHGWHRWTGPGREAIAELDGPEGSPRDSFVASVEIEICAATAPDVLADLRVELDGLPVAYDRGSAPDGRTVLRGRTVLPRAPSEIRLLAPRVIATPGSTGMPAPAGVAVCGMSVRRL